MSLSRSPMSKTTSTVGRSRAKRHRGTCYTYDNAPLSLTRKQSAVSTNQESSGELTAVVDDLLNQLNTKFTTVSSELLAKSKQEHICAE